jgi:4-hydroxybenzoate polyprenyltransferase
MAIPSKLQPMKWFSLFWVIRGYNILIISIAQYFSAVFIISENPSQKAVLLDYRLLLLVSASCLSIASGYIINSFYDSKKDLINKPNQYALTLLVRQETKLKVYFALNFMTALLSLIVSWKACLFFSIYIFLIWFYSHKIKKMLIWGNLMAAFMAIMPFFIILLYYKNWQYFFVAHATFLFLLLLIKEIIKDLENIKGDLANNYQTIPIVFGEKAAKKSIMVLCLLTIIPVYVLVEIHEVGYMDIYFYLCLIAFIVFIKKIFEYQTKEAYSKSHLFIKFLIVAGVFSILLINPSIFYKFFNWFSK